MSFALWDIDTYKSLQNIDAIINGAPYKVLFKKPDPYREIQKKMNTFT